MRSSLLLVLTFFKPHSNIDLAVILYGTRAETLKFDENNYKEVIGGIAVSGMTSFKEAFDETWRQTERMLTRAKLAAAKRDNITQELVIAFMVSLSAEKAQKTTKHTLTSNE